MTDDADISYFKEFKEKVNKSKKSTPKVPKLRINKLKFWCTACTQKFEVNKKDAEGNIKLPQQVCPHVTLTHIEEI